MTDLLPLPIATDHWRNRWLMRPSGGGVLHRISTITWSDGDMTSGLGTAVCGERGAWWMPECLSRLNALRCSACCKALGIPPGDGTPFNVLTRAAKDA